jgi:hypothetical protein
MLVYEAVKPVVARSGFRGRRELGGTDEMDNSPEHQSRSRRCPWLIRRFIDAQAQFLFVDESQLLETAAREDAIPFDAPRLSEVKLNHRGVRCSFEYY